MFIVHYIVLLSIYLVCIPCYADNFLCISLGESCTVAHQIEINKLTNAYYPFDWNLTFTVDSIIYALEHKFEQFLVAKNLVNRENHKIHDIVYDIWLVHDFPLKQKIIHDGSTYSYIVENWQDFIEEVRQKYLRRVQRFLDLKNYSGKLIFIRINCSHESVMRLKHALDDCFESHDLVLIIINSLPKPEYQEYIEGVKYYYISKEDVNFPGNDQVFKELFEDIIKPQHRTLAQLPE